MGGGHRGRPDFAGSGRLSYPIAVPPRFARALAGLCLLAGLTAPPAAAQPPVAPAAAAPTPIPAAEVADRAQEHLDRVRAIREHARPDPSITEIEEQLVASVEEVATLAGQFRERLAGAPSRRELERARFDFDRLRERLAGWSAPLAARAKDLDADLAELARHRAVWVATREQTTASAQAPAVVARIDSTLDEIDRAAKSVRARRDALLTIREHVAHQQSTVAGMLDLVETKRKQHRKSFLTLDSPPLWQALAAGGGSQEGLLDRMAAARVNDFADLRAFSDDGDLLALMALGAIGILVAVALRQPARRLAAEDETLVAPAHLLERPVAVGTVASLLVAPLVISSAPPVVLSAYGFALLLASLRLLVPVVDPELRRILYGLTVWYAIDRVRDRLVPDPTANRLLVLSAACLAVAILVWLLRPSRISKLGQLTQRAGWLRAIGFGMRIALLLNAVAVVCGVVGNTSLAQVLVAGSIASAWYAFMFFALSRVLGGIWALLLRSHPARTLRMVRNHGALLRRRGRVLIQTALVLGWMRLTLDGFDAASPLFAKVSSALEARWQAGELSISLGGIFSFALMVVASVAVSRFVRFALEEDVLSRASLPRGVPFAVSTLVGYAILLLGFGMAMAAAGLDVSRLTLLFGALGVGIGIGLQDIVNNFVSGLILLFERPVQVGDLVDVGGVRGDVRRIGIRASTVRTFEGAEVVIPNSKLVSESFVNWTLSDRQRRIEIPVGVGYASDPDRVIEVLEAVVRARPEVLREPPPAVLFDRLGESSLEFLVRAWAADFDASRVLQSLLTGDILRALREAGIEIPFPQRSLHLRSVDASVRQAMVAGVPEASAGAPARGARGGSAGAEDPGLPPAAAPGPG